MTPKRLTDEEIVRLIECLDSGHTKLRPEGCHYEPVPMDGPHDDEIRSLIAEVRYYRAEYAKFVDTFPVFVERQ